MPRRPRWSLTVFLISLAACSINPSEATVLELGHGTVVESYEFEALDPREWTFTVHVTAPIGSEVEVTFLTSDGATLHIFTTPSDPEVAGCVEERKRYLSCSANFPLLEARQPGTWKATVHKLSDPPADVHVSVKWGRPKQGV